MSLTDIFFIRIDSIRGAIYIMWSTVPHKPIYSLAVHIHLKAGGTMLALVSTIYYFYISKYYQWPY